MIYSIVHFLRKGIRKSLFLRKIIAYYVVPSGLFDKYILGYKLNGYMKKRLDIMLLCPENEKIEKVEKAGQIENGNQIMHNGIPIKLGSYYGPEVAVQLFKNKGIHEPQEEYIFQEVLRLLPDNAIMIELGSFWSFYSMWFNKVVKYPTNFMVEPESFNLGCGIRNFKLNSMKGEFIKAYVGQKNGGSGNNRTIGIDDFCLEKDIQFLDILHSDIQGYELQMLEGAKNMLVNNKIGYLFISTHTNDLHEACKKLLGTVNYSIVADYNLDESFSEDGLVVAKSPTYSGISKIDISKKR